MLFDLHKTAASVLFLHFLLRTYPLFIIFFTGLMTRLPSRLMVTRVSSAEISLTATLSRVHRTVTLPGRALASHENCTFSPSCFVWLVGGTMITAPPETKQHTLWLPTCMQQPEYLQISGQNFILSLESKLSKPPSTIEGTYSYLSLLRQ